MLVNAGRHLHRRGEAASGLVSLHDPDARPIVQGRLGKPVEFGYKSQSTDGSDGIVLDHSTKATRPTRRWRPPR